MCSLKLQVERNDVLGRHLVATRDIPAGTLILNELPMVVGPRQLSKPVCLGCHREIKDEKRYSRGKLEIPDGTFKLTSVTNSAFKHVVMERVIRIPRK